jgi:hypothetical protein
MKVRAGGGTIGTSVLSGGTIDISGAGRLDLTDHALTVNYAASSPVDAIRDDLASGYNGGDWDGAGINSSTAAASTRTALGYAEASELFGAFPTLFQGVGVDSTTVLVRYTLYGDANLNGTVAIDDFSRLAANFNQGPGATPDSALPPKDWVEGDFNYDQSVTIVDFALLAGNFNMAVSSALADRPADVPEPVAAAWSSAAAAIGTLAGRRPRRRAASCA